MTLTAYDNDQLFNKNFTVYGKPKMIEIETNYKMTLSEQQARELYQLLRTEKDIGHLTPDNELILVYQELRKFFNSTMYEKQSLSNF